MNLRDKLQNPPAQVAARSWREMSKVQLAHEYSPSSCIGGNYQPFIDAYKSQSRAAYARCMALGACWHEVRYGDKPNQRLDLCVPALAHSGSTPGLLVFVHGGYWQELSAHDSRFAAAGCIDRGVAFAALDYTLAPTASLPDIIAECRAAFACLMRGANDLGIDASNVVVAGSSAGAHLAAMVAVPGWHLADGSTVPGPKASVLVSGIFDLEPLVGTPVNDALCMDVPLARAVSPLLLPLAGAPPALVAWGSIETQEFKRQSKAFAQALQAAGVPCATFEIAGRNHFDVILDLADSSTQLGQHTLKLL